jgi:DNA-binding NtrC family response regulator
MGNRFFALLIHDQWESFESLKNVLQELSVETYSVSNVQDAARLLPQTQPHLIFTAATLTDGSWFSVMKIVDRGAVPVNVIIVGPHRDLKLYTSAIAAGAFDCIAPPFDRQALEPVVWAAGDDVRHRRRILVRNAAAQSTPAGLTAGPWSGPRSHAARRP